MEEMSVDRQDMVAGLNSSLGRGAIRQPGQFFHSQFDARNRRRGHTLHFHGLRRQDLRTPARPVTLRHHNPVNVVTRRRVAQNGATATEGFVVGVGSDDYQLFVAARDREPLRCREAC